MAPESYKPSMGEDRVRLLRLWHDEGYERLRSSLPRETAFMGLNLHISEDVFAPVGPDGDPFHPAVAAEVRTSDRVLDMGTGSGVSAILAAKVSSQVVAVDINPKAVACAIANAERNGVRDRITFLEGDVFDGVEGDFDLIIFDPPFRWFAPRDLLEMSTADENYRALARFISEARDHLRPGGRILIHFGSSGDIDYLDRLIEQAGFTKQVQVIGEATKHGITVQYYYIRLS
jgi:release factor glutamine methyltransferase